LIPFLVYTVRHKRVRGFFDYVGLKKSNAKTNLVAFLFSLALAAPLLALTWTNSEFRGIMLHPASVTGRINASGFSVATISIVLVAAIFKTSFSEELFFMGFIAKRLIASTSFLTGNLSQAIIFGAIHTLLFREISNNIFFLTVISIFPAMGAYVQVYLNEKLAGGSIIPGWIVHGTGNVISYSFVGFLI
jgi:membrane protease YdiL (CAAX protease family)